MACHHQPSGAFLYAGDACHRGHNTICEFAVAPRCGGEFRLVLSCFVLMIADCLLPHSFKLVFRGDPSLSIGCCPLCTGPEELTALSAEWRGSVCNMAGGPPAVAAVHIPEPLPAPSRAAAAVSSGTGPGGRRAASALFAQPMVSCGACIAPYRQVLDAVHPVHLDPRAVCSPASSRAPSWHQSRWRKLCRWFSKIVRGVLKLLRGQHPDMKVGIACCPVSWSDSMVHPPSLSHQRATHQKRACICSWNAGNKGSSSCAKGASAEWGDNPQQQAAQRRAARRSGRQPDKGQGCMRELVCACSHPSDGAMPACTIASSQMCAFVFEPKYAHWPHP